MTTRDAIAELVSALETVKRLAPYWEQGPKIASIALSALASWNAREPLRDSDLEGLVFGAFARIVAAKGATTDDARNLLGAIDHVLLHTLAPVPGTQGTP